MKWKPNSVMLWAWAVLSAAPLPLSAFKLIKQQRRGDLGRVLGLANQLWLGAICLSADRDAGGTPNMIDPVTASRRIIRMSSRGCPVIAYLYTGTVAVAPGGKDICLKPDV